MASTHPTLNKIAVRISFSQIRALGYRKNEIHKGEYYVAEESLY